MPIEVKVEGRRADLVLDRPDVLNAMDVEMFEALSAACDQISAQSDVRVVVVSGAGRSFCSGIDTSSFGSISGDPDEMIARAQAGYRKLAALEAPTVARVQGHALGAGLQVALACDLRVVAADAQLGVVEARFALVPDLGGTQRLPLLVGPAVAKQMIWLAEKIDGAEAGRRGLAEFVVQAGELDATVDDLADRLAAAPPLAVRAVKRLVEMAGRVSLSEGMDAEAEEQREMLTGPDFPEAVTAYIEGRTPDYR